MEIESSPGSRIFWTVLGLGLAGGFLVPVIILTLRSGPSPKLTVLIVSSLFPIGLGIAAVLWMGRPAWIRVSPTEVSFAPSLGSAKVFPRSSVTWIVRVPGGRGTSKIELRDQDNRKLVAIEQGFAKADMEKLAQFLGAKLTWDWNREETNFQNASDPASREQALQQMMAMMTPEMRAELEKRMKEADGRG